MTRMPGNAPAVSLGSTAKRLFLGWDSPVLPTVAKRLEELYRHDGQWDMRQVLIVLPTGLAVRRLNELLAIRSRQLQCMLYPPEIVTVGALPERLYSAQKPLASDIVQTLAWSSALQSSAVADLRLLVPNPPPASATGQWLELGKTLANLHRELASDGLDFAKVERALGKNHLEAPRWKALSKIQRLYLDELHSLGLWDVQTARLKALELSEPKTDRQILVIGCVDLNRVQRGFLNAVSDQVQLWIAAPNSLSGSFDPMGCLDAEQWQGQLIELPKDSLLVGNSPSDQAELVATSLAELGDGQHLRDVTLGVPDSTLIPELRHRLAQSGLSARFGPGDSLAHSQPAVLLALISRYTDEKSYSALAALVRHPTVECMLSADRRHLPSDWLSQMDDYYLEALPAKLDDFVSVESKSAEVYRQIVRAVAGWLKPLDGRVRKVSGWAEPLRAVLLTAFSYARPLVLPDGSTDGAAGASSQLIEAARGVCDVIAELEDIPEKLQPKLGLSDLIDWLLQNISAQLVPEPPDPSSIEMLGWLELAWDDAPVLIISGLHDGVVPESVNADAFLPNQLRRQLGMMDNARRLSRDIYLLKLIQANRRDLRIVVGKVDAAGNPLVPSRLLLACDLADLPARVLHLVQEENTDVLPQVPRVAKPVAGPSRLTIPRPQAVEPQAQITVTAFRDYLRCPYRFYLRHILGLRGKSDAEVELDAAMFGNLVHKTLDRLAGSRVASSTDPDEIAEFLTEQLRQVAADQFGPHPPATALIQIEQAQMRLSALAIKQAARTAEGWQIRFTERGSTRRDRIMVGKNRELCLIGRIDRIDYHPQSGQWAIWDYKTSETAKKPESVHYSQVDGWLDLQLPLYIPIAEKLGVTGTPTVGYIALPKRPGDIDFYPAAFDQAMLKEARAKADEVASKVAACEFWPETIEAVDYDDFARLCQTQTQQVQAPPPRRSLFRFDGYPSQRVDAQTVAAARQRLENPPSRVAIGLEPLLIRASAGTGKTFQLTNRLLQILLAGHDVDGILATTFTRKAAGEILQRVLQRLALGCISLEQRQELTEQLPGVECSAANCLATLRRVTLSIHRLRISTLDSFFAQLARTFSLDMGLPAGWTAMEPSREPSVQMSAISEMLQSNDHQTLLDMVRMLFKGESTRRVSEDIRSTVDSGLAFYRGSSESAWDQLPLRKPPDESACQAAISTVMDCRFNDQRIHAALDKLVAIFQEGDWAGILGQGIFTNLTNDPPTYYKKELPSGLVAALKVLREKAVAELLPIYRNQTLATLKVLQTYDLAYQSLIRHYRSLAFADVSHFLAQWIKGDLLGSGNRDGMAKLEYRLDCGVQHLLLDEFQDTSLEQWDILRPLAQPLGRESADSPASSERSFFCVGDSKQAIYGWRGGVAEIFDSVVQTISGLKSQELMKSFRSSPPIMQAVNEVFQNLSRHSNFADCNSTAQLWEKCFPEHETARKSQSGYVLLENGPPPKDPQWTSDERRLAFLEHTVARVAELVEKSSASIGILVRTNDDVARIMALLRDRHIAGSQDGGNPLTDSAAVELILSLIHLADHPGDSISGFHVCNSPLAESLPFLKQGNERAFGRWFAHCVASQGLGSAIAWVAERLTRYLSWWDQQRVEQLIRMAHQHQEIGGRLRDFEQFVESHRVALPSDSQVKVMTIHKSKGLEFDAVFLPALDISLTGSPPQLIARRPHPCHAPDGILRYMSVELQAELPGDWQRAFQADKSSSVYESLCILYVAMTRAKRALYMTTLPAGKNPRQDLGSLLQSTLAAGQEAAKAPLAQLYTVGDANWFAELPKAVEPSKGENARRDEATTGGQAKSLAIRLSCDTATAPLRGLRVSHPSEAGDEAATLGSASTLGDHVETSLNQEKLDVHIESLREGLRQALAANRTASAVFGKLIHAWLAQVKWLDDFSMDHDQLERAARSALKPDELRHVSLRDAISYFESALKHSAIRSLLSRQHYAQPDRNGSADRQIVRQTDRQTIRKSERVIDEVFVETERPISAVIDGHLVVGTIDRLVLKLAKGVPVAADVIDYKTDSPEGQRPLLWLDERVACHRPQLELYARVTAELYGLEPEDVGQHLVMLATGQSVRLGYEGLHQ